MVTVSQALQTETLIGRILELQSALFFTESSSLVKLPTHVIPEVEVDEEHNIWFVIARPAQHIDAFEKEIPAKLDFFRKGKDFFVKVRGTAQLVDDLKVIENKKLSGQMQERIKDGQAIAVRLKIKEADLVDNTPKLSQGWLQSGRTQLSSWFF